MTDNLKKKIEAYRNSVAKRQLSSRWEARRNGCRLHLSDRETDAYMETLASVCTRIGYPSVKKDADFEALSDVELALFCDFLGDQKRSLPPSPRIASFRYMRAFLFGRLRGCGPVKVGFVDKATCECDGKRREMLETDNIALYSLSRELMGEKVTVEDLDLVLQKGSVKILSAMMGEGLLSNPAWAGHVADAFWSDFISPPKSGFNAVTFIQKEVEEGRGESWVSILRTGFMKNGALNGNPLTWHWNAASFSIRGGWQCAGLSETDEPDEVAAELMKAGFRETFLDQSGISVLLCRRAYVAFRKLCEGLFGRLEEGTSASDALFDARYLVIDLSEGPDAESWPVTALDQIPKGGWTDAYKTAKLVLRRIDPGSFEMGSAPGELGRMKDEKRRTVTISRPYYCGVFPVTQEQWKLVMDKTPSAHSAKTHPVEKVSYDEIRGRTYGAAWPKADTVDPDSFLGRLRARTGLETLDLPTEAEWEYAARAGVSASFSDGTQILDFSADPHLSELGRYAANRGDETHAPVGSYRPNAWGLYDVHGNVFEWCLDRSGGNETTDPATDPAGPKSGRQRTLKGGAWLYTANRCRFANHVFRVGKYTDSTIGLRIVCR